MEAMVGGGAIRLEGQRNWNLWKFQVSVLLRGMDLYSVVDGSLKKPTDAVEWMKKDAKAQTQIVMRLCENTMVHILACQTAAEMWNKLHSVYEQKSSTSLHILQQRFFQFKFEEGSDMATFLAKLQELKTQLKQAGEEVSEKFMITKVLMSLPSNLNYFVSAWESVEPARQTYDELVARLLVEEERLKSRVSETESVALYAGQKPVKNKEIKCFKCGRPGHFISQCKSDKDTRKCFKCNKIGHLKSQCPKDGAKNFSGEKNNAFIASAFSTDFVNLESSHGQNGRWLVDSGASEHMVYERNLLTNYRQLSASDRFVVVGDGRRLPVVGIGDIILKAFNGHNYIKTTLYGVLYVPDLKVNLFSVVSITKKGYRVTLLDGKCFAYKNDDVCAVGVREGNFYVMDFIYEENLAVANVKEWHERLCHQNYRHIKEILKSNNIECKDENVGTCEACLEGKMSKCSFNESLSAANKPLDLIHADVCGPMEVVSIGGSRYFLLLKDDCTNYRQVFFMAQKSEVVQNIKNFVAAAERVTGCVVKRIRTDNGGEFVNKEMKQFLKSKGIVHETTVPYTPEQNGRAERDMRTLVEAARSMLSAKKLQKELWAEAINMVVYVLNRTSKGRGKSETPYKLWEGKDFDVNKLKWVFGSELYAHIPKEKRLKWDAKGEKGLFVGYEDSKGYRVFFENKKQVLVRRDVHFLQSEDRKSEITEKHKKDTVISLGNSYDLGWEQDNEGQRTDDPRQGSEAIEEPERSENVPKTSENEPELPEEPEEEESDEPEEEVVRTRSGRLIRLPNFLRNFDLGMITDSDGINYSDAMTSNEADCWKAAVEAELQQLQEKNTWTLVSDVPKGNQVISTKWVLKKKSGDEGIKYKARLVARGFEQNNVNNFDLYAPVATLNTFRIFMAVANKMNLQVQQMDELKEACKSFEKVLVQNLRFGLSISLTEAIEAIPRWRLIQAALPHVMHALAAVLHTRVKDNMQSLGNVETKLLYTLHWILLDASDECADNDYENGIFHSNPFYYLFSIPAMTLFVFLFAPLSQHLKESDFTNNFRLENGLKMWQALWEFRHPDAPCFTTLVKPKPKPLGGNFCKRNVHGDVFIGRKLSKEEGQTGNGSPPSQIVSTSQSEAPSKQVSTEDEPWISSPKETIFPETIPEESSSTEEEHVFILGGSTKEAYTVYAADPSLFQLRKTDTAKQALSGMKQLPQITKMSSSDKESLTDSGGGPQPAKSTPTSEKAPLTKQIYVSAATFLDVATLRCLFTSQWQEEGVYWALHYLYNRLRDICDDMSKQTQPRKRSNSLPIPKIEVSVYQSPDMKERDSLKNFIEIPEVKDLPLTEVPFPTKKLEEDNVITRRASEKIKRKMKMADLKAFVETKLLSKSEKALEKIGHEDHKFSFHTAEYHRSLDNEGDRPNSALGGNFPSIQPRLTGDLFQCNLIKGKSMPSLRYIGEVKTERAQGPSNIMPTNIQKKKNPIITVTEHTPTPSPDYLSKTRQGSLESQIDSVSMQGSQHIPTPERKPSLTRSQTDSNITYVVEEIKEAPGSMYYITKDGDIDFQVVLKAVYSVSTMDSYYITIRVMEVMLNLVDTLMEIGVHKNWQNNKTEEQPSGSIDPLIDFGKDKDKDNKDRDSGIPCAQSQESTNVEVGENTNEKTRDQESLDCPYYMIMHVLFRLLRQLGCSHGCTKALRGPQAECLRVQARSALRQLRSACIPKFTQRLKEMTKYSPIWEVLDNLHATIGFCAEPSTVVSPMNQQKRNCAKSPDISHLQAQYASNFGAGQGASANKALETFVIETTFRLLVTRFALMHKELKMLDNKLLYMEVRQLLSYVREAHGGHFRVVAFSGLLDTAERPDSQQKESNMQTTRVIRHIPRMSEEERNSDTGADSGIAPDDRTHKKFTFKKRSTSSTGAHVSHFFNNESLLETEAGDESASQSPLSVRTRRYQLTPRQSERTIPSASSADITPHHKISHSKSTYSKFHISGIVNWFRQKPSSQSLVRNGCGSGESLPMSGSTVSLARPLAPLPHTSRPVHVKRRVGHTLNRARKRVEDRLNKMRKMGKKRDGSIEETSGGYMSRRGSAEGGSGGGESEVVVLKRRRLVAAAPLYWGLARFNFLLDATQPGGVPDALFMAALLDLPHTVVVGRAAFLLECAQLVHNCNKGQWPYWLKSNTVKNVTMTPQVRQRLAGKLFYQWAEAIGNRLEEMLVEDKKCIDNVTSLVTDPDGQRDLLQQDEEEDFLDEASIRLPGKPLGAECPRALRIVSCVLLFEITTFMRETYQALPKTNRCSLKERGPWDRVYREANRRWSMALSSMGHSQASAQSLQSIAGAETERKISFVIHEPENVSGGSNATLADAIPQSMPPDDKKGRLGSRGKPMPRRNTQQTHSAYGSFKRRSIKLRQKDVKGEMEEFINRRSDSIQSRRKVSSLSDRSDTSEVYPGTGTVIMPNEILDSGGEESPGVLSDDHDHPPDSPDSNSTDPPDTNKGFPWLKVMVKFLNSFNYVCCHQNFCHPYCFRRNMRATVRLMKSVQKIYGEKFGPEANTTSLDDGSGGARRGRRSRKPSEHSADRIDRSVIESVGLAYHAACVDSAPAPEAMPRPAGLPYPPPDTPNIMKYLKGQVRDAYHTPLATLIKGATTMSEEVFGECAPVAWQLLLESDRELSACAAALFILAAVKAPHTATEIMHNDLKHAEPGVRINAILRFQVMWKLRYQVWPRMEEGASVTFKVPPPGIEFTLPSPKIGIESLAVVDPPWSPQVKDKDMEMTLNQERHRSLVTATKTRKKQQTEAIKKALQQRNDKKRAERESFLITTIPITRQAAREPALDHAADDHVEPPPDEEMVEGVRGSHHTQVASALFPSTLCSAVAEIVALLDDAAVSRDGCSVYEVAYQVIWGCLVEDSALFLRHVLERLTRDHQDEMFKLLRHLIRFIPRLPQQAAFALYNYIIGYVMFYVRSPHEEGQKLIGAALSILWMVVHSVHGIMFKDLKQILRKEQCDASILLTANVPAAKKIIVHGPADNEGSIPSQFPVQEDTVFSQILKESLDYFGIPEKMHREYFLVDFKTRQIHNPQNYVRDHYFFKRSQYPQLGLVHMEPDEAFNKLQQQELLLKFVEIGKVLLTWAILKNVDMVVQRVVFLHDELMKLPSFPRKALEADLTLYSRGPLGSTLLGLDVLHKFMWVRLIARMFEAMAGNFTSSRDIHLFLNVLNGALMLHSEDSLILRYVIATYVNAAFNFKNIFSTNGYLLIMPTLLQIYSNFQTNKLVTTTIEYAVKQFYLLNRKPFILQMFGSVSAILDTDEESTYGDASKVQSSCLFNLLLSLETPSPDPLHIAELIKEEKPLKPIDFCYRDEDEMVNVLDCISLCVMVVSYSAESMRGYQMLIILEAILPCYVKQIQLPTYNREGKTEKEIIQQLAIAIKTLVNNCEGLSKSYNGPYRTSPEHKGSSQRTGPRTAAANIIAFEESHSKYDNSKIPVPEYTGAEDSELVRAEYRRPRDVLLSLVGEFIGRATTRLLDLNGSKGSGGSEGKPVELLDCKSHARLAEIAHSLLKVSPYDPESMGCRGLQRYMTLVLPAGDWPDDALRPSLIMILRRLDKVFLKIAKKPSIRRNTDWDSAAVLLKGVYETMIRCPYIMHWQQVKTLLNTVQTLIVSESNSGENLSSATAALMSQPPPPHFCSTVVRLIALQIINAGDNYSLEQMCGGSAIFQTAEKTENMLMNLFMPLCLRVGSGRKDVPPLRQSDVCYLVSVVLNALCPPAPPGQLAAYNAKVNASDARVNSLTFTGSRDTRNTTRLSNQLYRIAFLALKVMCACFTSELCTEWGRIARAMRELGRRNEASHHLWDFLEHVVTYRTPLYILLQPFIVHKLSQPPIGDNERHMQFVVRERVRGLKLPAARARGALLAELARELRTMRDTHDQYKFEQIAENLGPTGGKRASEVFPRGGGGGGPAHSQHRPSLISMLVGRAPVAPPPRTPDHPSHTSHPPQRESLSSSSTTSQHMPTFEMQLCSGRQSEISNNLSSNSNLGSINNGSDTKVVSTPSYSSTQTKLRFQPSVEFKFTTGGESYTNHEVDASLPPATGTDYDSPPAGESPEDRPRLQRAHGPSKKTFKFRRSRHARPEPSHMRLESDDGGSSPGPESTPLRRAWSQPPLLQPAAVNTDTSYDSEISQTSSTSGYRESYSLQVSMTESGGGSVHAALASPEAGGQRTSSATPHVSPDASLSCDSATSSAERTALLGAASQRTLLLTSELRDEDTLL